MEKNAEQDSQKIYNLWHEFAKTGDYEGISSLYAENAVFESPLVPLVTGSRDGVLIGRPAIAGFFRMIAGRPANPALKWYRSGLYLTAGDELAWEYPRTTPEGEQLDLVEMMTVRDGLIVHHRIYLGWKACLNLAERWTQHIERSA